MSCLSEKIETDHYRYEVIETLGHCKGHIALVEPVKGWCFSGDLIVSERPKVCRAEENIMEIISSMKKLMDLNTDRLILLTSMGYIIHDGRKALQSCSDYLRELMQTAWQLEEKGHTIAAIRDKVFGNEHYLAEFTNGQFSSENLIRVVLRAKISG